MRRPVLRQVLAATIPPLLTSAVQWVFWPHIQPFAWFLFYPTVFLSSWLGGLYSGIGATVLSTFIVWWAFIPPERSFLVAEPRFFLTGAVYFTMGLVLSALQERLRRANREVAKALGASRYDNERLEKAMAERQVFAAFVENSSDFIGIADPDGKPIYVNPAGRKMVGMSAELDVGQTHIPEYYTADQRQFAADVIVKGMVEDGLWRGETYFRNWQTDEAIPVSDTHFMIREPGTNRVLGMGTITRDISDVRSAREASAAANRELQKANEEITTLYEKTRELDDLKTQFFANVSHELRTPLTLILGPTEQLLGDAKLPEPARKDLEVVRRNAHLLLAHVNDLLDIAKLDAGRLTPNYSETDVAGLVRFIAGHFDVLSKERGMELRIEAPKAERAQVDADMFQRMLMNLLSNAFKFTPNGGCVRVSLRGAGDRFVVEVADNGQGIPADKRQQVFERFRQLESGPTRRFAGTGLGLSIVKDFATALGGNVSVDDAPEGGALFVLELPRTAPPGSVVQPRAPAPTPALVEGAGERRARSATLPATNGAEPPLVLVVEDQAEMGAFIATALEGRGFRVITAADGREGYRQTIEHHPDLVLTDIMMPVMSGVELVRALRAHEELSSTPIVTLTAKADDELRVRLLREGVQDYLTKPFSVEELLARVGNHVARKRAEEQSHRLREQVESVAQASMVVSEAVAGFPESSLHAVLQTIALQAQQLSSAELAAVGIGQDPARPFETWAFVGADDDLVKTIGRVPRPVGLLGLLAREERSLRLRNLREHPAFRGLPPHHPPMTSFLGVQILYRGKAVGTLYLANKRTGPEFTEQDQRLMEMLAARAGVAIETARLYATEGLERAWLQAVVDQMPDGIVLIDATGRVTENRSVLAMAGAEPRERDRFGNPVTLDLRLPSGARVPPDALPYVLAIVRSETAQSSELVARRADGKLIPVLVSAAPVRNARGAIAGATMIVQDISTLKELERLREEWSSIVAHDLQQPINAIVLRSDLLLRAGLADKQRDDVAHIRAGAKRLSRMVNDLMDASQLETHRMRMTLERIDVAALVREVLTHLPEIGARTRVRAPADRRLFVRADAGRLEQVLTNLLSNAMKYGDAEAGIILDVSVRDESAEISVTNRGPTIPPGELDVLFERFVRSSKERGRRTKGSGLGLYIAKGLVEAHGGKIWAASAHDETTFSFTVPLDAPPVPVEEGLASSLTAH